MIEKIIANGRELQYSSKQIADEVTAKTVDRLMKCFIENESSFDALDILLFRVFLEKSLGVTTEGNGQSDR